jgi:hypothetical protein
MGDITGGIYFLPSPLPMQGCPGNMRFTPIIFSRLLAPINRRQFNAIVSRHAGDA